MLRNNIQKILRAAYCLKWPKCKFQKFGHQQNTWHQTPEKACAILDQIPKVNIKPSHKWAWSRNCTIQLDRITLSHINYNKFVNTVQRHPSKSILIPIKSASENNSQNSSETTKKMHRTMQPWLQSPGIATATPWRRLEWSVSPLTISHALFDFLCKN